MVCYTLVTALLGVLFEAGLSNVESDLERL